MKRLVDVDSYNKRLVIASSWATTGNYPLFLQGDWVRAVTESVSDEELGSLVRSALEACRDGVPRPDPSRDSDVQRRRGQFLKEAGARSETQYARKARHVSVYWNDAEAEMKVASHKSDGVGFEGMADSDIIIRADSSNNELGSAIRRAISVSVPFARLE